MVALDLFRHLLKRSSLSAPSTKTVRKRSNPLGNGIELLEDRVVPAQVAVFDNGAYVDTSGGTAAESDNIQATLSSLGDTVTTFTGTTAAAINTALDGKDAVVIPEQEKGAIISALSSTAKTAFKNFVSSGHDLIIGGSSRGNTESFLNGIFGFKLVHGSNGGGPFSQTANAAGTAFVVDPPSVPNNDGTYAITLKSLPYNAKSIYQDASNTAVTQIPFGSGTITFIAWDWFDAAPIGSQDSGWISVLDAAVPKLPTLKFDMNASTASGPSLPDESWKDVRANTLFSGGKGDFGWTSPVQAIDAPTNYPTGSTVAQQKMHRDFNYGAGTAVFKFSVEPFQTVLVKLYSYPASVYSLGMQVSATNGSTAILDGQTPYVTVTGTAGEDGVMSISLTGGIIGLWLVNGIEVTPLAAGFGRG